jgi:hypothetical protein
MEPFIKRLYQLGKTIPKEERWSFAGTVKYSLEQIEADVSLHCGIL